MYHAFASGGIVMWPLLAVGIGVLVLAARAAWLIHRGERPAAEAESTIQAILFWGVMSVLLGVLGTTIGIIQMAQAVGLAGGVEAPLLWGGFGVALVTLLFGLLIFVVSLPLWFGLRQWAARRLRGDPRPLPTI
jgi:biopolymer transport protein ExbB/TolQ